MFFLKKLITALVLPPIGPILLGLFGLWLMRIHLWLGRTVAIAALLGLAALSLPPVSGALMQSLERQPPISSEKLAGAQAIVILGAESYSSAPEYGGDTVGRWTLERLRYGVYLQRRSGLPILVAGGAPHDVRPVAELMKEVVERDFHGHVRWVENVSRDTAQNAAYSATLLKRDGIARIVLVSHSSHLRRAGELFARQGLDVVAAPTGFTTRPASLFEDTLPSAASLEESSDALHEWLGILVQRLTR